MSEASRLPHPGRRVGVIPVHRLAASRRLRDGLNGRAGFRECGLAAVVVVAPGGFGVRVLHPADEPIAAGFSREIDGVPVSIGEKSA